MSNRSPLRQRAGRSLRSRIKNETMKKSEGTFGETAFPRGHQGTREIRLRSEATAGQARVLPKERK
jgi:hypothetical protein